MAGQHTGGRHPPPVPPGPPPAPGLEQAIDRLARMNGNLALQLEELAGDRAAESLSDPDWANRVDRDYLWVRAGGAGDPQFRYMTRETIDMYAEIADFMYVYNPLIRRVVDVRTQFTFALDYAVSSGTSQPAIDAILKDPLNRQAFFSHKAMAEIDGELQRTGNVFIAVWKDETPVQVRAWSCSEIREIVTREGDANHPLFYIRSWPGDDGKEQVRAYPSIFATERDLPGGRTGLSWRGTVYPVDRSIVVFHVCEKKPLKAKFALTGLVAACRWARPHEKYLEDFAALVSQMRRYGSMITTKGGIAQLAGLKAQFSGDPERTGTPLAGNPAGSMIVAQEGTGYKVIDAGSSKVVGLADSRYYLLMVSAATGVPETYLTMDPSTGNLATAKEIGPVFITLIQERQSSWRGALEDLFRFILGSDRFGISFPPIRENLPAYIAAVNAFAKDRGGAWSGAIDPGDYIRAGYEALEWEAPGDAKVEALAAAIRARAAPAGRDGRTGGAGESAGHGGEDPR
jgi:hypothetical protein